eukprot:CAMPEP_0204101010 /NCGR_PEP_ID=MMETSP0360-20130528/194256_1 /ASSEMBLY_ACC=CAM_ASM_000342 /TAXON_ID=268821 /ORGANISM="Scrippsiella Hangoei, Strain SHTV-5" /LENGTH=419 /DNA_ID=CAMNT_0051050409 /DNA_START=159 /DNA_END=1417 /DNA_ORIENTATION=+
MTQIMFEHAQEIVERKRQDTQASRTHLEEIAATLLRAGRTSFSDELPRLVLHWIEEGLKKIKARQGETVEWYSTAMVNLDRGLRYLNDTIDHLRVVRAVRAQVMVQVACNGTAVAALDAAFDRWNRALQRYESARRLFMSETMTRIILEHAMGIVERKWRDTQASRTHLEELAATLLRAGRIPFSDELPRLVLHWTEEGLKKTKARQGETVEWYSTAMVNLDRGLRYLNDTIDHLRVVRAVRAQAAEGFGDTIDHLRVVRAVRAQALRASAQHLVEVIASFTRQHTWTECVDQLIRQGMATLLQFDVSSPEGDGPCRLQRVIHEFFSPMIDGVVRVDVFLGVGRSDLRRVIDARWREPVAECIRTLVGELRRRWLNDNMWPLFDYVMAVFARRSQASSVWARRDFLNGRNLEKYGYLMD